MRILVLVLLGCLAAVGTSSATPKGPMPTRASLIRIDWQEPLSLPPRLRNHCVADALSGRPYCSDHCGFQNQVYYCSPQSFGCCRIGFGYCDWHGWLRCHP